MAHAEIQKIKVDNKEYDAIIERVAINDNKGALIILPDPHFGVPEPIFLEPFQKQLAERLWTNISLPKLDENSLVTSCLIQVTKDFTKDELEPIYLIGIASHYEDALKFVAEKKSTHIEGLILVSPYPFKADKTPMLLEQLIKAEIPVLIVNGTKDYEMVLHNVDAIQMAYDKEGNEMLRHTEILGTHLREKLYSRDAARAIIGWLSSLKKKKKPKKVNES